MSEPPLAIDAYSRVIESQQETIAVQRELIGMLKELERTRQQLVESTRLELRATQMLAVLRIALLKLVGAMTDLADDRTCAKESIHRAQEECARATALAEGALELITTLDERAGGEKLLDEAPLITVEAVTGDLTAALERVRQFLGEQDSDLDRLESEIAPLAAAERLFAQFVEAPMPVAILDAAGYFLRVNATLLESLRYSADDLLGKQMAEIVKPSGCDHEHLVLPATGGIAWYRIQRWKVFNLEIVVFEDDSERARLWMYGGTMLPDRSWLAMWREDHAFSQINACRVIFDPEEIAGSEDRGPDFLLSVARRIFRLTPTGQIVVQLGEATFLFIVDRRSLSLDELVSGVRPTLEIAGEGLPFILDAAECGPNNEIFHDLDTAGLWTEGRGRDKERLVRTPVFSGACVDTSRDGPLLYQPFKAGDSYRVRAGKRLSLPVFKQVLGDLAAWHQLGVSVSVDFVVSSEELRLHDWGAEASDRLLSSRDVRILLDGNPDFDDYVLLRRFAQQAESGVVSSDEHVLMRARQLKLTTSKPTVLDTELLDAQGVVAWIRNSLRAELRAW